MARFYSDENFQFRVIDELRSLGHDVLTARDAGNANRQIGDPDVLAFSVREERILITGDRRDFLSLHRRGTLSHFGIIVCTYDPDVAGQAQRIHQAVLDEGDLRGKLLRVNRPNQSKRE